MTGVTMPSFSRDDRTSGILLHVTSLPSRYGVGDFGPAAVSWIDQLDGAGQSWWQFLPLGPTGYGNSPYQPVSSFAGNTILISPDWLIEDELLEVEDCTHDPFPIGVVDYGAVLPFKRQLLVRAWKRFKDGARLDLCPAYEQFCRDQAHWLADYALFQVLKLRFDNVHYLKWPRELAQRNAAALDRLRHELADQIDQVSFSQFLLFRQADRLKRYAHAKGLGLIGDLPFFVAEDSSDVWANPELFLLDEQHRPRFVAGVPPDYFSAQGQLWGNPVYDWQALEQSGYRWWIARFGSLLNHVDLIRLDHFRGFAAAWHVPEGSPTAQAGQWIPGPGAELFRAVEKELGVLPFVAEDLGMITPDVYGLRDQFHLPGTRVLQFAFDGGSDNPHLPTNYVRDAVVYTGTHDNPTSRSWVEDLPGDRRDAVWRYLREKGARSGEAAWALMELAWSSVAALAVAPVQDLLKLGREARMNTPGRSEGNWRWRCADETLSDQALGWLRDLTQGANRSKLVTHSGSKVVEAASGN